MWKWLGSEAAAISVVIAILTTGAICARYLLRRNSDLRRQAQVLVTPLQSQAQALAALSDKFCLQDEEAYWAVEGLAILHESYRVELGQSASALSALEIRQALRADVRLPANLSDQLNELASAHTRFEAIGRQVATLGSGETFDVLPLVGNMRSELRSMVELNQRALENVREISNSRVRRFFDWAAV